MLANSAPPRQSAPAALADGAPAGGAPSAAPAATVPQSTPAALSDGANVDAPEPVSRVATSAPRPVPDVYSGGELKGASDGIACSASADGCQAAGAKAVSPVATPAPKLAPGVSPDGGLLGASAEAAAGASADGSAAGAGMPVSPLVTPAPESAPGVSPDGSPSGVSTGAAVHTTRDSAHSRHQSLPRATAPHSRGCPATRMATRRWTLLLSRSTHRAPLPPPPIFCRSTTSCRSPRAAARTCSITSTLLCPSQLAPRQRVGCAAGTPHVAPPRSCWRAARLGSPTACRWTWPGGTPFASPRAERASSLSHHQTLAVVCHLRTSRFRRSAPSATIRSAAPLAHRL